MTVLSYAKHALALNQKRFRQIDNEQHNSHTDPCTGYVRILYHYQLRVTSSFDCRVDCQIHQRNHPNPFFQFVPVQLKVRGVSTQTGAHGKIQMRALSNYLNIQ